MKSVIFATTLLFHSAAAFAQSGTDLQFSQIINGVSYGGQITVGTVPSGKIWKVVGFTCDINTTTQMCGFRTMIGGEIFKLRGQTNGGLLIDAQLPIYFNENETVYFEADGDGRISIIEYTVLP
jgi:hypothetical protein